MAKIGYARVSTDDQNLDLQHDALKTAGCEVIYSDKLTGKNVDRPELQNCLKALRSGDTLVVWRLDRLGRSLRDLVLMVGEICDRGISFASLRESIDTNGAAGRMQLHMLMALTEYERELIRERTLAGLTAARARGRVGGRKRALTEAQGREVRTLMADPQVSPMQIAERYGISRSTLYKYAPRGEDTLTPAQFGALGKGESHRLF